MTAPQGKYAWTATVGEKGQIVIPKQAREIFGIKPGISCSFLVTKSVALPFRPREHLPSCSVLLLTERMVMRSEKSGIFLHTCTWSYQSDAACCR